MNSTQKSAVFQGMNRLFYIPLTISIACLLIIFCIAIIGTDDDLIHIVIALAFIGGAAQATSLTSPLYFLLKNKIIPTMAIISLAFILAHTGFMFVGLTAFSIYGNSI